MREVLHYAIDASLIGLACFGLVELGVFIAAMFITPAEFDWPEEDA